MTGYQETLTDPSYRRQIVAHDRAAHRQHRHQRRGPRVARGSGSRGYVVRDPARVASNWRAGRTLDAELRGQGIVGIAILGTRALTRHLRERGAMRAGDQHRRRPTRTQLLAAGAGQPGDGRRRPGPRGHHAASPTPSRRRRARRSGTGSPRSTSASRRRPPAPWPRWAARCTSCPADRHRRQILARDPDGVFFSNGPGDPAAADYAVELMRGVLAAGLPVFGICLGSQILGRALGLGTYKLRYGHRGMNQPVQDLRHRPGRDHQPQPRLRRSDCRRRGRGDRSRPRSARPRSATST